ncbi:VanZ family protein [Vibrio algarum]|uniref:VanZ family protein n=1 Tax=Vibrio algarum TaxID=3020714 RepID=A0ABT4YRM6_9VIBR|nr:VanZ family protein [Vibrio sp. KJ40-1]MDB1123704.1 VanZ family protein [Vibrio sp. KJ40-1]
MLDGSAPDSNAPDLNSYGIENLDKVMHFIAYCFFSVLAFLIVKSKSQFVGLCAAIVLYSLLLELAQSLMPFREASLADFIANTVGVIIGAILISKANRLSKTAWINRQIEKPIK